MASRPSLLSPLSHRGRDPCACPPLAFSFSQSTFTSALAEQRTFDPLSESCSTWCSRVTIADCRLCSTFMSHSQASLYHHALQLVFEQLELTFARFRYFLGNIATLYSKYTENQTLAQLHINCSGRLTLARGYHIDKSCPAKTRSKLEAAIRKAALALSDMIALLGCQRGANDPSTPGLPRVRPMRRRTCASCRSGMHTSARIAPFGAGGSHCGPLA